MFVQICRWRQSGSTQITNMCSWCSMRSPSVSLKGFKCSKFSSASMFITLDCENILIWWFWAMRCFATSRRIVQQVGHFYATITWWHCEQLKDVRFDDDVNLVDLLVHWTIIVHGCSALALLCLLLTKTNPLFEIYWIQRVSITRFRPYLWKRAVKQHDENVDVVARKTAAFMQNVNTRRPHGHLKEAIVCWEPIRASSM